jgi:hypothetical protein
MQNCQFRADVSPVKQMVKLNKDYQDGSQKQGIANGLLEQEYIVSFKKIRVKRTKTAS